MVVQREKERLCGERKKGQCPQLRLYSVQYGTYAISTEMCAFLIARYRRQLGCTAVLAFARHRLAS